MKYSEKEDDLNLILHIFKDSNRIKYGKRLYNYGVIQIIQMFNNLLQKNIAFTNSLSTKTKVNMAETLGVLYYFKHN